MKFNSKRVIGTLVVAVLMIGPAILVQYYGLYAEYQTDDSSVTYQVVLPDVIGNWRIHEPGNQLAFYVKEELGLRAYDCQIYQDAQTEKKATLLLMFGHAGKLVRHPPEICYTARGLATKKDSGEFHFSDGERDYTLKAVTISRSKVVEETFVIAHGFFDGQIWSSPRFPRIVLAGKRLLHKIQLLYPIQSVHGPSEQERKEVESFLSDMSKTWVPN